MVFLFFHNMFQQNFSIKLFNITKPCWKIPMNSRKEKHGFPHPPVKPLRHVRKGWPPAPAPASTIPWLKKWLKQMVKSQSPPDVNKPLTRLNHCWWDDHGNPWKIYACSSISTTEVLERKGVLWYFCLIRWSYKRLHGGWYHALANSCRLAHLQLYPSVWSFGPPRNSILAWRFQKPVTGDPSKISQEFPEWKVITFDQHANPDANSFHGSNLETCFPASKSTGTERVLLRLEPLLTEDVLTDWDAQCACLPKAGAHTWTFRLETDNHL